jgi:Leucine-rich repeat (LRR) protein
LYANKLTFINAYFFEGLEKLEELNLNKNQLEYIEIKSFTHLIRLKLLNLDSNKLKVIQHDDLLDSLVSLNQLWASKNLLENFCIGGLKNLEVINLNSNRLISIQFFNLSNLTTLNLSSNHLGKIEIDSFKHLPNLRILDLNQNYLDRPIIENDFELNFNTLLLQFNVISYLERGFFAKGHRGVRVVYLSANSLKLIEEYSFKTWLL